MPFPPDIDAELVIPDHAYTGTVQQKLKKTRDRSQNITGE